MKADLGLEEKKLSSKSLNKGKGQEITGVSLPSEMQIKGWEFGQKKTLACARVKNSYYGIQGVCPRCGFDLWKGTIVTDAKEFGPDVPRVACPTCAVTYSLKTGKAGATLKQKGLSAFVNNLAKSATVADAAKDAQSFVITREDNGKVFCRET